MNNLVFYVRAIPVAAQFPCCLLIPDTWNDYGFVTQFHLSIYRAAGESRISIGPVKIFEESLDRGGSFEVKRTFLEVSFQTLDPSSFCSLGQSSDYYANLGTLSEAYGLPPELGRRIAESLCDVCLLGRREPWVVNSRGVAISLLRFPAAHVAKRDAMKLLAGEVPQTHTTNSIPLFSMKGHSVSPPGVELLFDGTLPIPGRINVLVGKNGAGKTLLLRKLAEWIGASLRGWEIFTPNFSRAVLVSNNVFDRQGLRTQPDMSHSVKYVGNRPIDWIEIEKIHRQVVEPLGPSWTDRLALMFPEPSQLLSVLPTATNEVLRDLTELKDNDEWRSLTTRLFDDDATVLGIHEDPHKALVEMSAGQKALAGLFAGIFVNLDKQGLVLIDEPENFLHPSLTSRFIRSFNELLDVRKAFGLIATHSPIVVQETPARFVWVVSRNESETQLSHPDFETFGESIENIDEYLFETDFRSSHWKKVLKQFVESGKTDDQILEHVGGKSLPLLARTFLERERIKRRKGMND